MVGNGEQLLFASRPQVAATLLAIFRLFNPVPLCSLPSNNLLNVKNIEITSWLASAYDFYSRVVENHKRTSESSSE